MKKITIPKILEKLKWSRGGRIFALISASSIGKSVKLHSSLRMENSNIADNVELGRNSIISRSTLSNNVRIYDNCFLYKTKIDSHTYVNQYAQLLRVNIGKYCSIASHVYVGAAPHPMDRITTHPMTFLNDFGHFIEEDDPEVKSMREETRTSIGHDVWIGQGVVVMPNIGINSGAIIGAHSVVTKDVPPFAIVAGNPAKVIRYRFDDETIQKLMSIAWWDWDETLIKARISDFYHIKKFVAKYHSSA